jgi:hypothetical protein
MAHLDELLDQALKDTFPASDPVAINVELEPPEHEQRERLELAAASKALRGLEWIRI